MIDADERRGLGKPVTLNHGESEASPEFLRDTIERCSTGDEGPEFPSKLAMNMAKGPPAAEKVLDFSGSEGLTKFVQSPMIFQIAFNFFFERLQHARDRDQDRGAFT